MMTKHWEWFVSLLNTVWALVNAMALETLPTRAAMQRIAGVGNSSAMSLRNKL
jgi:hypothetical protein